MGYLETRIVRVRMGKVKLGLLLLRLVCTSCCTKFKPNVLIWKHIFTSYNRLGFDCENLMIVNCEFFYSLYSIDLQVTLHIFYNTVQGRLAQLLAN